MDKVTIVYSNSSKILSKLIQIVTWSKWSHVAMLTEDGKNVIEAVGHGVREIPLKDFVKDKRRYTFQTYNVNSKSTVIEFARSQIGKKYDFSALFGIFFKRDWEKNNRWFCSELVTASLQADKSSPFRNDLDGRITPSDLWKVNPSLRP